MSTILALVLASWPLWLGIVVCIVAAWAGVK